MNDSLKIFLGLLTCLFFIVHADEIDKKLKVLNDECSIKRTKQECEQNKDSQNQDGCGWADRGCGFACGNLKANNFDVKKFFVCDIFNKDGINYVKPKLKVE